VRERRRSRALGRVRVLKGKNDPVKLESRKQRLLTEVRDEGVPALDIKALPSKLSSTEVVDMLVEEILYARHAPVHEGLRPTYACLVVPNISGCDATLLPRPAADAELASLRPLADGLDTFLVRDPSGGMALIAEPVHDELALVRLTRRLSAVAVQLTREGDVKVFNGSRISVNRHFDWVTRPYARDLIPSFVDAVALPPGDAGESLLRGVADLLDFCVHRLSPDGTGATFVVDLAGDASGLVAAATNSATLPSTALNAFDPLHQLALAPLVASVDGACLIGNDGNLAAFEAMLGMSEDAKQHVSSHGGTRHTSAKRFTFDHPEVVVFVVFVVSADGPVTGFCDGAPTFSLRPEGTATGMWRLALRLADAVDVQDVDVIVNCGGCSKALRVLGAQAGSGPELTVACPICGQDPVHTVASGIDALAIPLRVWPPAT
jgi:hypothetical protein